MQQTPEVKDSEETEQTNADLAIKQEGREHVKIQMALADLGKITGCSVWIASNDQKQLYNGKVLNAGTLQSLPNLGLSREAVDKISLIDVIWLQQNAPVYAFEVETTTQVYSGLLRMSDLLALVPALNIKLFIVAPMVRQGKVMRELARPTFQKIGLSEYCRFLPSEKLDSLFQQVQHLGGHVHPTVLNTIAVELESDLSE